MLKVASVKKANNVQVGMLKPMKVQSTFAQSPVPLNNNFKVSVKGKLFST